MLVKKFVTYVGAFALLSIGSAQAVVLGPGGTVGLSSGIAYAPGTLVASTSLGFVGKDAGDVTRFFGTINLEVRSWAGGLDFLYQISNNAGSLDPIHRFTTLDFRGYTTDVDFANNLGGSRAPAFADRSANGSIVGFDFETVPSGGSGLLTPGQTSNWVVIRTNAPAYGAGSTSIINGGTATVLSYAPVPEPATMALAGLALAAAARRRARKS